MAFPDDITLLVRAQPEAVEKVLTADHEGQDDWNGDGRTHWYWLLTSGGDVMLITYPTGGLYEDLMDEIAAAFDTVSGARCPVTHERSQRLLLDL